MNPTEIYGVNLNAPVTPVMVRDAMVRCFKEAHSGALEDLRNYAGAETNTRFEKIKELNITTLAQSFFTDVGGDFDNPTKEDLYLVISKFAEYAKNFRNPDIIAKHRGEIELLINKLP